MARVLVVIKLMPESADVDLKEIQEKVREEVEVFGGYLGNIEEEPIAFGLVALKITFSIDEQNSNLDPLEEKLRSIEGVVSAEVIDVRRAIG